VWILINTCSQELLYTITYSLIVGAIFGVVWAVMVTSINNPDLMYLSKSGVEVCSRPSKTYFSCKPHLGSKPIKSSGSTS
jgi:hypothetical protein